MNSIDQLRPFTVTIPTTDGKTVARTVEIKIPMEWDIEIGEWLLAPEATEQIERTKAREAGHLDLLKRFEAHYGYSAT
jgi:hypothetical protein